MLHSLQRTITSLSRGAVLGAALTAGATAQVWTQVQTPQPAYSFVTDPNDLNHLLAQVRASEWEETFDGGATWTAVQGPTLSPGVARTRFTLDSAGNLLTWFSRLAFANPSTGPVAMIRVGGAWQPLGPDLAPDFLGSVECSSVTRGTLNPNLLTLTATRPDSFGGTTSLYVSLDSGATWGPELSNAVPISTIVESAAGPYLIGAGTTTNPTAYTSILRSTGLDAPTQGLIGGFDLEFGFAPQHPNSMWAIGENTSTSQIVQRSTDGGATWSTLEAPTGSNRVFQPLAHPTRPDCLVLRRVGSGTQLTIDGGLSYRSLGVSYFPLAFADGGRVLFATSSLAGVVELYRTELFPDVGVTECSAEINGSGARASIEARGSASIFENELSIVASSVTPNQFGYFLVSENAGFVANPAGSFGNVCLSGRIGRYFDLQQNAGPYGQMFGYINLSSIPTSMGPVVPQVGQTWRFQAWFRDAIGGVGGSNFSDAVAVTLLP